MKMLLCLINFSDSEQTMFKSIQQDHLLTYYGWPDRTYTDILADSSFVDQELDGFEVTMCRLIRRWCIYSEQWRRDVIFNS